MALKNEVIEELENLSPYLAALPCEHPFTVPENYFALAEQYILLAAMDSTADVPASLFTSHDHPFEVPNEYFEELHNNILLHIKQQPANDSHKKVVPIGRFSRTKVWLAAA
ncbi:MAG: hypothetical protein ABIO46_14485, partial [Chitinophagales bacterium]